MPSAHSHKTKVVVVYGGPSTEHEVSCRSAAYIIKNLDKKKYDVSVMAIDKVGRWQLLPQTILDNVEDSLPILDVTSSFSTKDRHSLVTLASGLEADSNAIANIKGQQVIDTSTTSTVVFPIIHGNLGEDGSLQGFLETLNMPYVGPDLMASSMCMDKVVAKNLVMMAGVPVVPFLAFRHQQWLADSTKIMVDIEAQLNLPVFVKPARGGSSVGISKAKTSIELKAAIDYALKFDDKILVEKALQVREIEFAALGGYDPEISEAGEVIAHAEFYSYDAKYLDANASEVKVPAELPAHKSTEGKQLARRIFCALDLYGMARIDLFLEKASEKFYFNEVNTIPGFTSISQYPKLWEHSGYSPQQLLDRLIELAQQRHKTKNSLQHAL